jgi:hypothetical protein
MKPVKSLSEGRRGGMNLTKAHCKLCGYVTMKPPVQIIYVSKNVLLNVPTKLNEILSSL